MRDLVGEGLAVHRQSELGMITPAPAGKAHLDAALSAWRPALLPEKYQGQYRAWGKRTFDIVAVLLTLPVTLPVIALCAVALWLESGLPFYTQSRIGRNGRWFRILKLRTMVRDADARLQTLLASDPALRAEWDAAQKLKNDPRITPVGAFLRATSLDELPQLWNVLTGEMSLVGPRPMLPDQMPIYGDPRAYLALRPGIPGAWQVTARSERSFALRATFDADYHTYLSLWEDLVIMWQTLGVMVRRSGH